MLYIIMTTPLCNLCCKYCGGSLHGMPADITYSISDLQELLKRDNNAVVAFYGGEPLLKPMIVKEYVENLNAKHFVINTNGYFIETLDDIIHRFDSILLSIDGGKQITDYYREKGCYDRVISAVDYLNDRDFNGEIIARMSVSVKSDIYEDVMHLLKIFPFVHWQLDMIWSAMWDLTEFKEWVKSSYLPGIQSLVKYWVEEMKDGNILGIVPFLGIVSRMLHGGSGLFCQSGTKSVTVTTDGKILACPIAPDYTWNILGDIETGFKPIDIGQPCIQCDDYYLCGGRCLFAHKERLWGQEGFDEMCHVTRFLIHELMKYKPIYEKYVEKLRYPLFNNTTEIIP
ncbi:MAG: putative peptide-modifying radical SAM/SPASM domain-containing protein [Thermoplasmata archaeon]|nr:MAG: putative peptide-modifying radical SAM/SPASM domain-containing protein [Thermoplasmata archaeon]